MHGSMCCRAAAVACIFEFVYLARPDSVLDGISVYQARLNLGETLAKRVISTVPPNEIDVVIPIPESSRPSATQLAHLLGIPYREGFVKNRYVGRTFIMPGQEVRKKSVRQKLNVIASEFKGRNVLLVDDSIVRGTTSKEIVQMARDAGARKVYLASAAPPVRYPNVYGIDMPTRMNWWRTAAASRRDPPDHRLRCADLPGCGRHEEGHRHAEPEAGQVRCVLL
jgi:amidophosphoribosyltransferase